MADVVVVGAGPVGMTAAALLSARGAGVAVLEARPTTSTDPKAISVDDESLRTFADADLIGDLLRIVSPGTGTRYYDRHGDLLLHARGPAAFRLGYPFKNPFSQPDLEAALASALRRDPRVDLRFGARVTGLDQDEDGVTVQLHDGGAIRARYAIGADGGRSTVREALGIAMTGRSYTEPWLVIDTLGDPHREMFAMHIGTPQRPTVIIPSKGGRCRYEFLLFPGEGLPGEQPRHDLIAALLKQWREISPAEVERAVIYTFNGVVADEWRRGRVFLAGDAAHMMPPFAGQGLNTGLRDVANLTWKLAAALTGQLSGEALDSYAQERRPHAAASVRLSERLGRVVHSTSPRMAAARDRLIGAAMATPQGREFFEGMRYRPPLFFQEGLVAPDGAGIAGRPVPQPRGYDMTAGEVRYLDAVTGYGWTLLGVGVTGADWREALAVASGAAGAVPAAGISAVHVCADDTLPDAVPEGVSVLFDVDGMIKAEFGPLRGRFLLVRPDHVIAATWHPDDDTTAIVTALASWLTRVTDAGALRAAIA